MRGDDAVPNCLQKMTSISRNASWKTILLFRSNLLDRIGNNYSNEVLWESAAITTPCSVAAC